MIDHRQADQNWATFQDLVNRSRILERRGRHEPAAVAAMTAATFAWCNPTGSFASPELERVLVGLGASVEPVLRRPVLRRPQQRDVRPRVLHVASQLYATGGHTQMLANWLHLDSDRDHHVVVTAQGEREVPKKITASLTGPDSVTLLDSPGHGLVTRAATLRRLAVEFDHIVLHVHPNDVVAWIALSGMQDRPEVLLVNHADHVFWLGASLADRVVNLRHSGARLNAERRGIAEDRNALLVRPLQLKERSLSREEARSRLGIDSDAVVIVSAADTYKYGAAPGEGLLDVLLPVLRDHPEVRMHVAGPSPDGDWKVLADEGLGRAWGLLPDVGTLLEAADIYIDSYPFSSLTSMLEAATLHTPVMTWRDPDERVAVLGADTPELEDVLIATTSGDGLAAELVRLIESSALREELGMRSGAAVRRFHSEGSWLEQVGKVFDAPSATPSAVSSPVVPRQVGPLDLSLARVMQNGVGQSLVGTLDVMAPELGWLDRLRAAALLAGQGRARPALLLPAPWARRAKDLLRSLRRAH
ncbi:hypothetical protein SAMN04489844_0545 [Nocardioides exalbidus]|uniref:Uncharacterized protein n=1 Tax=Nocardioides exalbidus TaxID=402596 RepID=A0A1H4KE33_9ACTN|nr:hypothetical protein [Nocardioides exalbidus]SEB56653.1 hypothetical protein SAMN04489844_0545 [Nocardioides exalbidus]